MNDFTQLSNSYATFINNKVKEKTEQQLKYVLSSIDENAFLEACAGSGKTEVVGMKTAYEINRWGKRTGGIAVLTFTNDATETIRNRVEQFARIPAIHPHYIGTLTGFIHGFVAQKFGYKYFPHRNNKNDTSYALIDKNIEVHNNHWLKNFQLPIKYITQKGQKDIYANQIYYNYKINDYIIHLSEDTKVSLTDYYNSENFQEFVLKLRSQNQKDWLLQLDYIKEKISEVKIKFLKNGFANFEDMNNIAYVILKKDAQIATLIAAKYPVIFVDECQDLSWIEICILEELSRKGVILHFIGDLNQSIYEFKNAIPEFTNQFVLNFKKYELTDNFRSCQFIVDVANRTASIQLPIRGLSENKLGEKSVFYLEYSDISLLSEQYSRFLKQVNISPNKSAILVRQQILKDKINKSIGQSPHLILDALQLWGTKTPRNQILALELAGKQLQKWFGGSRNKKDYYCPLNITSVYSWRIFLRDYLEAFSAYPVLLDFSKKNYGQWYKIFNEHSFDLIHAPYKKLQKFDNELRNFSELPTHRTPSGTANKIISQYTCTDSSDYPVINTIHSVKGKDFDGVMVVSSQRNTGSGHWKQWIKNDGEARRIGYVASTRAKYSLIWAVPTLKKEEKVAIESYGFKPLEINFNDVGGSQYHTESKDQA